VKTTGGRFFLVASEDIKAVKEKFLEDTADAIKN
jgi:hypothetical protein